MVKFLTAPNILSLTRIALIPFLLMSAWYGFRSGFLILLGISLATDALDGFIARKLGQTSELGAKLDSLGDICLYLTIPLCIWWLWPEIVTRERIFIIIALAALALPLLIGLFKFGRLTSYHTWAAKGSAVFMALAIALLLLEVSPYPFRICVIIFVCAEIEEIMITLRLTEYRSEIPSYLHLLRQTKENQDG